MPRKASAIVQYKLRIRESLRRQIERAAKARDVSANYEMASRLERSFEQESQRTIDEIGEDLKVAYPRFMQPFHDLASQGDLRRAAEMLVAEVERMPAECREREGVEQAIAAVKQATATIDIEAAMAVRRMGHV